jgi:hypothetical protein
MGGPNKEQGAIDYLVDGPTARIWRDSLLGPAHR